MVRGHGGLRFGTKKKGMELGVERELVAPLNRSLLARHLFGQSWQSNDRYMYPLGTRVILYT